MKEMIVYALSHPVTGEVRYVGKSERGLVRPRQHGYLSQLKKVHIPVLYWIKKLRGQGLDYVIEVVEEHDTREALMEAEKFYISYFRFLGFRLLNLCEGGEGFTGRHTAEAKAKIGAAGVWRRISQDPVIVAKRVATVKARWAVQPKSAGGPEANLKRSLAHKGKKKSPEHAANISKGKIVFDPATIESLYRAGVTPKEIARQLSCSEVTIYRRVGLAVKAGRLAFRALKRGPKPQAVIF